jgi:hypothetical protein
MINGEQNKNNTNNSKNEKTSDNDYHILLVALILISGFLLFTGIVLASNIIATLEIDPTDIANKTAAEISNYTNLIRAKAELTLDQNMTIIATFAAIVASIVGYYFGHRPVIMAQSQIKDQQEKIRDIEINKEKIADQRNELLNASNRLAGFLEAGDKLKDGDNGKTISRQFYSNLTNEPVKNFMDTVNKINSENDKVI